MEEMDIEHRLTEVESRSKSNKYRIDKLEASTEAINRLAVSMEGMAAKQEQIGNTVDKLDSKVEALEAKPGQRYDSIAEKVIWAIVAAVITFILSHMGL